MLTKLRAIFSNKTINKIQNLPSNFNQQVEQAISLFANHGPLNTDEEVLRLLTDNGIRASEAKEILLFLPITFVRQWLTKMSWVETYLELSNKSKTVKRKFSETKSYQIIWQVTANYFMSSPQKDTILKIAGRSAEFHVINQVLLNNPDSKLEDIKLTQIVIIR